MRCRRLRRSGRGSKPPPGHIGRISARRIPGPTPDVAACAADFHHGRDCDNCAGGGRAFDFGVVTTFTSSLLRRHAYFSSSNAKCTKQRTQSSSRGTAARPPCPSTTKSWLLDILGAAFQCGSSSHPHMHCALVGSRLDARSNTWISRSGHSPCLRLS